MDDSELTSPSVRRILTKLPPAVIEADLRYIHGMRAFFIAASGTTESQDITIDGSVFAFQPTHLTVKAFQKAVRPIRRDFETLSPEGYINPYVLEGIEMEAALRMLEARRTVAWLIDGDGSITRYSSEFGSESEPDMEHSQGSRILEGRFVSFCEQMR